MSFRSVSPAGCATRRSCALSACGFCGLSLQASKKEWNHVVSGRMQLNHDTWLPPRWSSKISEQSNLIWWEEACSCLHKASLVAGSASRDTAEQTVARYSLSDPPCSRGYLYYRFVLRSFQTTGAHVFPIQGRELASQHFDPI